MLLAFFAIWNLFHLGAEIEFMLKRPALASMLYPYDYRYSFQVGAAYLLLGNYKEAERFYRRTVETFPTFVEAKNNLAVTWAMMGRKAEAETLLREILAVDPGYESARANLYRLRR